MSNHAGGSPTSMSLPRPGRALKGVMLVLLALWLMFAMAINWADADPSILMALVGTSEGLAKGEIWRLLTAPLLHLPGDPWHLLGSLIGLYFLTPGLEERWGAKRLIWFLWLSGVVAYGFQVVALWLLPADVAARLSMGYWLGATPVIEAVAVAWAMSFRGQVVRLFFVLPVTTRGLLAFIVGISLLRLIAVQQVPEGLLSPFGGLAAGWLLGGGTPSPARRLYLKLRYRQLQREAGRAKVKRSARVKRSGLSVIEGGKGKRGSDDDGAPPGGYLN